MSESPIENNKSLIIIKFFIVFAIVYGHIHIWMVTKYGEMLEYLPEQMILYTGIGYDIFKPMTNLVLIIAGITFYSYLKRIRKEKKENKKKNDSNNVFPKVASLCVWIVVMGMIMNSLTWGFYAFFDWRILNTIAISFILIVSLDKILNPKILGALGLIILSSGRIISEAVSAIGLDEGYGPLSYVVSGIIGVGETWPAIPWTSLVIFGFVFAQMYDGGMREKLYAILSGAILITLGIASQGLNIGFDPDNIWAPIVGQPHIGELLGTIGIFMAMFGILELFSGKMKIKKYGIVDSYSRGIFYIYLLQIIISFKIARFTRSFPLLKGSLSSMSNAIDWGVYLILPVFMILISWVIGYLAIRLIHEKKIVLRLKKNAKR